jgi:hypothetical protein
LRKATGNFVMPLPMEQLGSHWTDFCEIWYLRIFRKYVEKIQVILKCDEKNGYFTWRLTYIYGNISLNYSQNEKCLWQNCRENQNTHFILNIFSENRAVYEVMWENMLRPGGPQMTV